MALMRRKAENRRSPAQAVAEWRAVSARHIRERARQARRGVLVGVVGVAAVLLANKYRMQLFGLDTPVRVACAIALGGLGGWLARDIARVLAPPLLDRLDPGTAGTVGFLLRLGLLLATLVVALRMVGLSPEALAVGGAATAVVLGLAAQSTIGNLLAGMLLISVRPFRVGERVRLQSGALAGLVEGTVSSLGLLYVMLTRGEDNILVPNAVVLQSAIVPLREPESVDLRARLRPDVKPSELQRHIQTHVCTETREEPHIHLEEIDDQEVVMRVTATPERPEDGPKLADEILAAVAEVTHADKGNGNGRH
jgi:small-conductance mechanosensitive channel